VSEFESRKGKEFLLSTSFRQVLGPIQLSIQWLTGTLSPGIRRPGREADHEPTTSAEVKRVWIYTSTTPYSFMAYCLISLAQEQLYLLIARNRDSSVGTDTGYGLGDREAGVRVPIGSRIFSSPRRPYRFRGPPSLLFNGYRGFFPGSKAAGA
jgi:hypothetical protein